MDKKEIRYFMLFFAILTALLFSGGKFNLLIFIMAVFCYAVYFTVCFGLYRIFRKGAVYVFKILKKYYREASETLRRLGSRK